MSNKTHAEKTAAADKSIGFEFQFYYFLFRILQMREGETTGMEVDDDVSTKLGTTRQILIQLKHTVQQTGSGTTVALTTLDGDLWKTLANWAKYIRDPNAGRATDEAQLDFTEKTDFLLATNKSDNQKNKFILALKKFKAETLSFKELKSAVIEIKEKTANLAIKDYIGDVLVLSDKILERFFRNIDFDFDNHDIIGKCQSELRSKMIPDGRIESALARIESKLRQDNFTKVQSKQPIEMRFEDFYRDYQRIFEMERSPELQIEDFAEDYVLTGDPLDLKFIKQLIDINDVSATDMSTILEYIRAFTKRANNFSTWISTGLVTASEEQKLHNNAKTKWRTHFKHIHKTPVNPSQTEANCQELLYKIREQELQWSRGRLDLDMSHGEYYHLSNLPEIGWHPDWENKYKC